MSISLLKIFFFFLISLIIYLFDSHEQIGAFYFYYIIFYTGLDFFIKKRVDLIHVWNFAFIFIILSEVFVSELARNDYFESALRYLIVANNLINIGYLSNYKLPNLNKNSNKQLNFSRSKFVPFILFGLVAFFFLIRFPSAIQVFLGGRTSVVTDNTKWNFLEPVLGALGLVLPSIITYYYTYIKKKNFLYSLLFAFPVLLILFLSGTRFPLLFSFLGLVIIAQTKMDKANNLKRNLAMGISLMALLSLSQIMVDFRSTGSSNESLNEIDSSMYLKIPSYLSASMSPEGVVDMTSLLFDHFEHNDHFLGSSSSFILYFWVPRELWSGKPTMLGHWFVREYREGFSSGHSASLGFTGDLYVDFGIFSLVFIFFLGRILKKADNYKDIAFSNKGYSLVLAAMLFPYVFFFVRSPITATTNFLGICFFYFLFHKILFQRN